MGKESLFQGEDLGVPLILAHNWDDSRDWLELSAAIARGDTSEAAFLLDRIAERFGLDVIEQVQRGRYSQRGQAGRAA